MLRKPLPIGIDDFEKMILGGYYYVDKTLLIKELLDKKGEVTLFTRPRRFGKTVNISMLRYYFEDTGDEAMNEDHRNLFRNLEIIESGETYLRHMCSYPLITLSLKSGKRAEFSSTIYMLCEELRGEFNRHRSVMNLLPHEKCEKYQRYLDGTATQDEYSSSLKFLSEILWEVHGKKVVILIDEYDVPLENAWFCDFYDQMTDFIRSLFEGALKTNPGLEFAVMTGCLRISKESIFTGLNNLEIVSILTPTYDEYFGFRPEEMNQMMDYYGISDSSDEIKEWYDGYQFGNVEVYNPWSAANYIKMIVESPGELPLPFWANTSSNSIIKTLIKHADLSVKSEIESLLAGGTIEKPVHEDITYGNIYESADNLWNFLFFTGYLKKTDMRMENDIRYVRLAIPNREVRYIYNHTIMSWFRTEIEARDLSSLYTALMNGEPEAVQKELNDLLVQSISYMDSRESGKSPSLSFGGMYYHGFLLGILGNMKDHLVTSNRESGLGRYDICVRSLDVSTAPVILELKISDTYKGLDNACDQALNQIREMHYNDWLPEEGYTQVWDYGIAFFKKQCRVKAVEIDLANI